MSWVLGGIALVAILVGFGSFYRYKVSERHFVEATAYMNEAGKSLDVDGCVSEVIAWHKRCAANKPMCDEGVPKVMTHCLAAADRTADCAKVDLALSVKSQWVLEQCSERGTPCYNKKTCPCANAFRTIDSFCRHDQKGVAL